MSILINGTIYMIKNVKTGKTYIGQTVDLERRKRQHYWYAFERKSNYSLYSDMRKYGWGSFEWDIIFNEKCTPSKLNAIEIFFIGYYDTFLGYGYNQTIGGEGSPGSLNPCHRSNMPYKDRCAKAKRALETKRRRVDPKTGFDMVQIGNIKSAETQRKTKVNAGKNNSQHRSNTSFRKRQLAALKARDTMRADVDPETGLDMCQRIGLKTSRTLRERGSTAGKNNSAAKRFLFTDPSGGTYVIHGGAMKFCNEHNLTWKTLRDNPGRPATKPVEKKQMTPRRINTTGWTVELLQ